MQARPPGILSTPGQIMATHTDVRTHPPLQRLGASALAVAAILFVLYPALRPYGDLDPASTAAAFASPAWLVAHLSAVLGFLLVGAGLVALYLRHGTTALAAAVGAWSLGSGLTIAYYGAETFALHTLGQQIPDPVQLGAIAESVRTGPVQVVVFALGLSLLAVAAVLAAFAVRGAALPFAAAMVLFLPQFFAPPALRMAHGVLLGIGCALLAAHLVGGRRAGPDSRR
jgi:hypothetical protein